MSLGSSVLGITAIYLTFLGCGMETKNFQSTLVFKVAPIVLGFLTGLMTFKVIQ